MDPATACQRFIGGIKRHGIRWLLLSLFASALVAHGSPAKSAWKEIEKLVQATAERATNQDGAPESAFNSINLLNFRLEDFISKYPDDPRRWDAEVIRLPVVAQLAAINNSGVDWAAQQEGYAAVLAAPAASKETKIAAQTGIFHVRLMLLGGTTDVGALRQLSKDVEAYYDQHRKNARAAHVAYDVAKIVAPIDGAQAESILTKIAADGDGELPAQAGSLLRVVQGRRAPMELSFTGLDGRKVDIAALRGKVVLIDFWATWCAPCRAETGSIVAIYRRWHEQGLEIIGISLDEDRKELRDYLQQHGITWSQQFDGGGWQNQMAQRFGIHSVPTMWLVNKQGYLVDVEGRDDLTSKVQRLLAE